MSNERERLIELQKSQWKSLEKLCTSLSLDEWGADTDCPTWTVKDCIAHLVGIEHRILGRKVLDIPLSKMSHIKNEQGAKNELDVVSRRAMTPAELLREFAEVNSERLKELIISLPTFHNSVTRRNGLPIASLLPSVWHCTQ